jgi:hypothetical protein
MKALLSLVEVFVKPVSAFERMKPVAKWLWAVGLALLLLAALGKAWVQVPYVLEQTARAADARQQAEMGIAEQPQALGEDVIDAPASDPAMSRVTIITQVVFAAVGLIVGVFVAALFFFIFAKVWAKEVSFLAMLSMIVLTRMPVLLRDIVQIIYMLVSGRGILSEGLGALVVGTDPLAQTSIPQALLGRIDVWVIWSLLLLGVGLAHVPEFERKRIAIALGIYAVAALFLGALPAIVVSIFTGGI